MKRFIFWTFAFFCFFFASANANQPTVTRTADYTNKHYDVFKFTFTSGISTADSVFLGRTGPAGDDDRSYFDIGDLAAATDSSITVSFQSSEATADSIRYTAVLQFSMNDGFQSSADGDFSTVNSDATVFTNTADVKIKTWNPGRYGSAIRARIILFENDTSKDASQTVTVYVKVPKAT